jgi:ketosteroid isomerase-like protein
MKTKNLLLPFLFLTFVFTADVVFSQSSGDYKAKIDKLNKEMTQNMIKGDTEKNLKLYTEDAISMPSNEPMHQGLNEIRKANEDMTKSGWKVTSFEPTTLKIIPNGNMITEVGTYKISMTMPKTDKPMDDHGKYLTIWEKQPDGSLKVKIETWNSDVDPMTMMKSMDQMMGNQQKEEKEDMK